MVHVACALAARLPAVPACQAAARLCRTPSVHCHPYPKLRGGGLQPTHPDRRGPHPRLRPGAKRRNKPLLARVIAAFMLLQRRQRACNAALQLGGRALVFLSRGDSVLCGGQLTPLIVSIAHC